MGTTTKETTGGVWVSITEAADAIGVNERTIRRRRDRGEIEGRHRADGGRQVAEVLIEAKPDHGGGAGVPGVVSAAIEAASERIERPASVAITAYQARADRAELLAERAEAEVRRVRAGARLAWGSAAALLVGAAVGGVLGARELTTAQAASTSLTGRLADAQTGKADADLRLATTEERANNATDDARRLSVQASGMATELSEARAGQVDQANELNATRLRLAESETEAERLRVAVRDGLGVGVLVQDGEGTR